MGDISSNHNLLKDILQVAQASAHNKKIKELNLSLGFIYYGLVRALRPKNVLVIGSGYGCSVVWPWS